MNSSSATAPAPPALLEAVAAFLVQHPGPAPAPDTAFNALAGELFTWQYTRIAPYQRLCDERGMTPESWDGDWRSIPSVPAEAFKHHTLFAWPTEEAAVCFLTSGTTAGERRGKHWMHQLRLYDQSAWGWFRTCVMPDAPAGLVPVYLAPSPQVIPESSLAHMLGLIAEQLGPTTDPFFLRPDGVDVAALEARLQDCCDAGQPVFLATTSYALSWWLERSKWTTPLPPGSRAMETGGFKGFVARYSAAELTLTARHRLGIEASHWVSEYGMTELSSQCYGANLRAAMRGDVASEGLIAPPWMRLRVIDPVSGADVGPGVSGQIAFCDLANVDSVAAIYTQDVGRLLENGHLVLEGRLQQAPERGCSLTALEMLGPV